LVQDAEGNLYGTTYYGGANGNGTVFLVDRDGKERLLHSFTGSDGANPLAGLIQDAAGNFYGTTQIGGDDPFEFVGTVFAVNRSGQEKVLLSFNGNSDGYYPYAGLVRDASGNFYGTTLGGPLGYPGTVFRVNRDGKERVLHIFNGTNGDGASPQAGLVEDAAGNLYGTTSGGGAYGQGTVFMVNRSGEEKVLYSFTGTDGDGSEPLAGLVEDAAGNLYGTTEYGGHGTCNNGYGVGCGIVFVVNRSGQEKVLYSFTGTNGDGAYPLAGLILDAAGNLYGTTSGGGAYGYGTVFELTP
jgi:uncharacterized repeat protein (TIGR03803 family)